MVAQVVRSGWLYFAIILLVRNVKSENTCTYLRPKYGVGIDTDKCQFENFMTEQVTFSCIEKCDMMPEVRIFVTVEVT